MNDIKLIVKDVLDEIRIDKYISNNTNLSRTLINELISKQQILLNNRIVKKNFKVKNSDVICIHNNELNHYKENTIELIEPNPFLNIPIVYEDQYLLIINKPNNILMYPTSYHEQNTIANWLLYYFNAHKIFEDAHLFRYGIVHRLDRFTTGLLIIGKSSLVCEKLINMFNNHSIVKKYLCIVHNCFNQNDFHFKIDVPIGRSNEPKLKMIPYSKKDLKQAITIVNVINNIGNKYALVECELITGRTHQIRTHMKYVNHPIYNDPLYGSKTKCSSYNQYLHCYKLSFNHPITNEFIDIKIDIPEEFNYFINKKHL